MSRKSSTVKRIAIGFLAVILLGFLVPERLTTPVEGATVADWNKDTFWYEPWGESGVHKGIDIFAPQGKSVLAAAGGIVVFQGSNDLGGNIVLTLGPKWRFHYYAHMDSSNVPFGRFVSRGELIGSVGSSGNAAGKQPHLHYAIVSAFPHPWLADRTSQGWKKMFYLDPNTKLRSALGV